MNIVQIWREHAGDSMDIAGSSMVDMAMRIESMVPNSAATEHFFSLVTGTHTKVRNRMSAEKARKTVVLKQHIQREHGAPPSYRRKRAHEDKVNQINLATTPAPGPAHGDVEAEILAGLDELDVDDPAQNVEPDGEQDPMTMEPQVLTFDEIARDLMQSGDEEDAEDDEEQASDSEDELNIDDPEAWQLVNLFTYPTFSADADRTQSSESFAFMVDYWNQGKTRLEMEQEQHEILSRDMELGNESNDDE